MSQDEPRQHGQTGQRPSAKELVLHAGTELFRRQGFVATTVEDICRQAGVTKGAFFHHFHSKEDLAATCLQQWDQMMARMLDFDSLTVVADPVRRLLDSMNRYRSMLIKADYPACLAGTTVQEVAESHPRLREAARACFSHADEYFATLLGEAAAARQCVIDAEALASLWTATIQGSLLLFKAGGDRGVIDRNLRHASAYIAGLLGVPRDELDEHARAGESPPPESPPASDDLAT